MSEASGIRDEFRLLLLCARTRVEPQQRELIRALVLKQLDWEFILGKAHPHALIPLLYRNLSNSAQTLFPQWYSSSSSPTYTANAKRNLALTAELIKVLRIWNPRASARFPTRDPPSLPLPMAISHCANSGIWM